MSKFWEQGFRTGFNDYLTKKAETWEEETNRLYPEGSGGRHGDDGGANLSYFGEGLPPGNTPLNLGNLKGYQRPWTDAPDNSANAEGSVDPIEQWNKHPRPYIAGSREPIPLAKGRSSFTESQGSVQAPELNEYYANQPSTSTTANYSTPSGEKPFPFQPHNVSQVTPTQFEGRFASSVPMLPEAEGEGMFTAPTAPAPSRPQPQDQPPLFNAGAANPAQYKSPRNEQGKTLNPQLAKNLFNTSPQHLQNAEASLVGRDAKGISYASRAANRKI